MTHTGPLLYTQRPLGPRRRLRMRPMEVNGQYVVDVSILYKKGHQWKVVASRTISAEKLRQLHVEAENLLQAKQDIGRHGKRLIRERGLEGFERINQAASVVTSEAPGVSAAYEAERVAFTSLLKSTTLELIEEARKRGED